MTWNSVLNNLLIGSDGAVCQLSSMPQIEGYVSSSGRGEADAADRDARGDQFFASDQSRGRELGNYAMS